MDSKLSPKLRRINILRGPRWSRSVQLLMIALGAVFLFGPLVLLVTTKNISWSMLFALPVIISGLLYGPVFGAATGGVLLVAAGLIEQAIGKTVLSSAVEYIVSGITTAIVGGIIGQISLLYFEREHLLSHVRLMLHRAQRKSERLRQMQQALQQERNLLKSLIEILPVSVYVKDADGKKTLANKLDVRFTGRSSEADILGKSDYELFPKEIAEQFSVQDRIVLETGAPVLDIEENFFDPDGQMQWLVTSKVPLLGGNGAVVGLVGVGLDITKRKMAEELLRQSLHEKETLLQEVHHRVRNNLNVISSLLNMQASIIRTQDDAIKAFQYSRDRVMAIASVHQAVYESRNYDRIDIRNYIIPLTKSVASRHSRSSAVRIVTELESIVLDVGIAVPSGLILNELITNALRHAFPQDGPGEIQVAFRQGVDGSYEFSVSDNGIGLAGCTEESVFGTLGLSIVRSLVQQISGVLTVNCDKGTSFHVRVPATSITEVE